MTFLFPILTAVLNRFRGGGFYGGWIRDKTGIHPRILASVGITTISLFLYVWLPAVSIGVSYLIFVSAPWGRWYSLNRCPRILSNPPGYFETVLETIADFGNKRRDWLALGLRNSLMALPGGG